MDKTCYIVGAGECMSPLLEYLSPSTVRSASDMIIAADGGFKTLEQLDIIPDFVVGDFDSLGKLPVHPNIVKHPVAKDDTDMRLAVDIALEHGYTRLILYGGTGGRFDHTMANLQLLAYISTQNAIGYLAGSDFTATAITNSILHFDHTYTGTVSVFCNGTSASGVYLQGLLYPLDNAELTSLRPVGVSNSFTGVPATVKVTNGTLLVIWFDHHKPLPVRAL